MTKWLSSAALLLGVALTALPAGAALTTAQCLECHSAMTEPVEIRPGVTIPLQVEEQQYRESVHGGFECVQCHIGITAYPHVIQAAKADRAVRDLAAAIAVKSTVDPLAQASCVQCHPDAYQAYRMSVHGQNVMVKKSPDGPVCTSCHGSPHTLRSKAAQNPAAVHFAIVESCGGCHQQEQISQKYGFSPLVMQRYLESFHGRKLKLGHTNAPSCASCHGSHDVKSQNDPASPVVGANKLATCGTCHPGATPKFAASFTHDPLHPIAHWAEISLIILTVGTFGFIVTHVLLDLFYEIRRRLGKKGGTHE